MANEIVQLTVAINNQATWSKLVKKISREHPQEWKNGIITFTVCSFILTSGNGPARGNIFSDGLGIFVISDNGPRDNICLVLAFSV